MLECQNEKKRKKNLRKTGNGKKTKSEGQVEKEKR
jgi:hypothetical protein